MALKGLQDSDSLAPGQRQLIERHPGFTEKRLCAYLKVSASEGQACNSTHISGPAGSFSRREAGRHRIYTFMLPPSSSPISHGKELVTLSGAPCVLQLPPPPTGHRKVTAQPVKSFGERGY